MGWDFSSVFYKLLITDLLNNFFLKHRESGTRLALSVCPDDDDNLHNDGEDDGDNEERL